MILADIILILFIMLITLIALIPLMNYKLIIIDNTDSAISTNSTDNAIKVISSYKERKIYYE
jgi:hypothetical protein